MRRLALAVVTMGFLAGATARGDLVLVTDRAALGGDQTIDWGQVAPDLGQIPNPSTVVADGGLGAVVTQAAGNGERREEGGPGSSWVGNFALGDRLYYTGFTGSSGGDSGPITLSFDAPVRGVGTQIQYNLIEQDFVASVTAFDASGNVLATFTEDGVTSENEDGSAIFLGVLSDTANIASVTFGLTDDVITPGDFAINQVSVATAAVPEPASLLLLGGGAVALVGYARRRRPAAVTTA